MRRTAKLLSSGSACLWIAAAACGGDAAGPPADPEPVVSSIRVVTCFCGFPDPPTSERTIGVLGTKVLIIAEALGQDGAVLYSTLEHSSRFSWSSSDSSVATVEMSSFPRAPLVTGVSEGRATIAATSRGVTGGMTVTVRDRARLAWSVPLPGGSPADITIGADGTIYVARADSEQSRWYAVSSRGVVLWTLDLPQTSSTPAIGADGTLYGGLLDGGLIAVSPGGTVRWTLSGLDDIHSSPAIGPDGTVYVAGYEHLYAVNPEGEIEWAYETPDPVFHFSPPAVARDGTIYVGGTDGILYAINPNGSLRWKCNAGLNNIIYSGPSISRDGTIYFGSLDGVYAVSPEGSGGVLLRRKAHSTPSIGPDGTIYVGTNSGERMLGVYALDPNGSVRWTSRPSTNGTPILGADGTVYVTATGPSGEQVVAALDSQGRLLWDYAPGGPYGDSPDPLRPPISLRAAPAIGVDGMILAVSSSPAMLYAIVEKSSANGGFAGSPWPTARGNRANNGRAGG